MAITINCQHAVFYNSLISLLQLYNSLNITYKENPASQASCIIL